MSFLLDTDICSAHLKQQGRLTHKFLQYIGRLNVSVLTAGELFTWALRAKASLVSLMALLYRSLHIRRVQSSLRLQLAKQAQRPANPFLERRTRHRAEVPLQRRIVEVIRDRNLPFTVGDEPFRRGFDRAQGAMERRHIHHIAA